MQGLQGIVPSPIPEEFFQNALHCEGVAGFGRTSFIFERISMRIS